MNLDEVRLECTGRLFSFAQCMFPRRYYGEVHKDLFDFFQFDSSRNKMGLIPRDHQKSHVIAVYCAWAITVDPSWSILYVSSNHRVAKRQLSVIKSILLSEQYKTLWPDILNYQKNAQGEVIHKPLKGNIWTQEAIEIDHPLRAEKGTADPTIAIASVGGSKTGQHAKEIIFDDLVTDENYKSQQGRREVVDCYINLSKIASSGAIMKGVGTRYTEGDLYTLLKESCYPVFENGEHIRDEKTWSFFERVVEDSSGRTGDGEFLWPKQFNEADDCYYGFDQQELAIKKSHLTISGDQEQLELFYAQYYNDANDISLQKLNKECFIYFDPKSLEQRMGQWFFGNRQLRLYAAADLAFTDGAAKNAKKRDFTAIAVVGLDSEGFVYILDLDRFQTGKVEKYYERILSLHDYWGFRTIDVETNNGGKVVVSYLEDEVRRQGKMLVINGIPHTSHHGKKEERISSILEPRYRQKTVYHKKGGLWKTLEEELVLPNPAHDDLKDVVSIALSRAKSPKNIESMVKRNKAKSMAKKIRFGGRRRM